MDGKRWDSGYRGTHVLEVGWGFLQVSNFSYVGWNGYGVWVVD